MQRAVDSLPLSLLETETCASPDCRARHISMRSCRREKSAARALLAGKWGCVRQQNLFYAFAAACSVDASLMALVENVSSAGTCSESTRLESENNSC